MKRKITLTLTEELLGTKAANPEVFAAFIASKHPTGTPQRDELEKAENKEEAGTTVFHRENGQPIIYDYQIKGFFKDAASAMNRFDKEYRGGKADKLAAFKSKIDGALFVFPRMITLKMPEGAKVGVCERPLRAQTPQGERVSVCRSETVPPGTVIEFDIEILSAELQAWVELWLDYGGKRGLGCWRNSGKGRFQFESVEIKKQKPVAEVEAK